jgi:hypothetical protein
MKNLILSVLLILGTLFAIPVNANEQESIEKSIIDLSPNKPVQKLFPLTILSINGKNIVNRSEMIMLEPGKYHLKFFANVDLSFFAEGNRVLRTKISQRKYEDSLDLVVEAGNSYQLGFDARPKKVEDWKPIVLETKAINK